MAPPARRSAEPRLRRLRARGPDPLRRGPGGALRRLPLRRPRAVHGPLPALRGAGPARRPRPRRRTAARLPRDDDRPLSLVPARSGDLRLAARRLPRRAEHASSRTRPLRRVRRLARARRPAAAPGDGGDDCRHPRPRRRPPRSEARAARGLPGLVHPAPAHPAREALARDESRSLAPRRLRGRTVRLRVPPAAAPARAAGRARDRLRNRVGRGDEPDRLRVRLPRAAVKRSRTPLDRRARRRPRRLSLHRRVQLAGGLGEPLLEQARRARLRPPHGAHSGRAAAGLGRAARGRPARARRRLAGPGRLRRLAVPGGVPRPGARKRGRGVAALAARPAVPDLRVDATRRRPRESPRLRVPAGPAQARARRLAREQGRPAAERSRS